MQLLDQTCAYLIPILALAEQGTGYQIPQLKVYGTVPKGNLLLFLMKVSLAV